MYDFCIIGAGIMGASIARELTKYNKKIVVLESNPSFGLETTGGNSGLIHGGFDPKPDKSDAKLNYLGKKRYKEDWFKQLDFAHKQIDSLVLAFNDEEVKHIEMLLERGFVNGCTKDEICIIDAKKVKELEPSISNEVKKALWCTSSVVIDPVELTGVLLKNAKKNGAEIYFNKKVSFISKENDIFTIKSNDGSEYKSKFIINAAGHYADVISELAGYPDYKLAARRGEYIVLYKNKANVVNNVLFMVPTIHGKGVLVAPTLDGYTLVGPTAEENIKKEDTRLVFGNTEEDIKRIGKTIIPGLDTNVVIKRFAGSRPLHKESGDFYIKFANADKYFINVAGTKSPGISSAPAIADMVIDMIKSVTDLERKSNWDPYEKNVLFS